MIKNSNTTDDSKILLNMLTGLCHTLYDMTLVDKKLLIVPIFIGNLDK